MSRKYEANIVGTGYVGMSMAVLLAQYNEVIALDIDEARVDLINQGKSTVVDAEIEHYLAEKDLSLTATIRLAPIKTQLLSCWPRPRITIPKPIILTPALSRR